MSAIRRLGMLGVLGVGLWSVGLLAEQRPDSARPVVVDVLVHDRDGRPITDLRPEEFSVREDGREVKLTGVTAVTPAGGAQGGRSVILVLDDVGVIADWTNEERRLAEHFLKKAGPTDRIAVVRFSQRRDQIGGTRSEMAERIAQFVGGARPFAVPDTVYEGLRLLAALSSDLARTGSEPQRHAIVWIGDWRIVDVSKPGEGRFAREWPNWLEAIRATSRVNASVYAIHPRGGTISHPDFPVDAPARAIPEADGVILHTSGTISGDENVLRGADRIWDEIGSYYLLKYDAPREQRELHEIQVRVSRPDVRIRARRARG